MRLVAFCLALAWVASASAAPLDDALELYRGKKYVEARTALEQLVTAEPGNAAACHWLGLTLGRLRDPALAEQGVSWLQKASELEPANPTYLFEYGGASLQLASLKQSLSAANRGRDALEKVVALVPSHVEAHQALLQFYSQAPWPIGDSTKAADHLAALRAHDPERAAFAEISWRIDSKDYADAFAKCDQVLTGQPDNYGVLLQYARASLLANQNLPQALDRLLHALTLPPARGMPGHAFVHWRIGNVHEKLGDVTAARAAYEQSLGTDANFAPARKSLDNLK